MVFFREIPSLSPSAELLLLALASSACPRFQVDFSADGFAPLLGWLPPRVESAFREIDHAGLLARVPEVPDRWQIHPQVKPWIQELAEKTPVAQSTDSLQDAAQMLLLLRMHAP